MRKSIKILAAAAMLSAACAMTAYAGWNQDDKGYWYQYDNGFYAKGGIKTIDGVTYAFDEEGYMLTGWQYISFRWYYFDTGTGAQTIGWTQLDGKWYYLDPKDFGSMYTSWLDIGKDRYYLDESGVMKTGVFYLAGENTGSLYAYEADENGVLIRNTTKKNGNRTIRYDSEGVMMYRNDTTQKVNGVTGEGAWQYVLNEEDMNAQKEENQITILKETARLKAELSQSYITDVIMAKASKREQRLKTWKAQVTKKLGVYISEEEIAQFIASVEEGKRFTYRESDYDEDYDYEEYEEY